MGSDSERAGDSSAAPCSRRGFLAVGLGAVAATLIPIRAAQFPCLIEMRGSSGFWTWTTTAPGEIPDWLRDDIRRAFARGWKMTKVEYSPANVSISHGDGNATPPTQ